MKKFNRTTRTFTTVVAGAVVLAVFGTGTAVAGGLITSKKIQNNTIKSIDVKNDNLKGLDVRDESLTGTDLANGTVGGADVADFSLSNQDVGVLFATVNANGTLANASGGVTSSKINTGQYDVNFGRSVTNCAFIATPADPGTGSASSRQVNVADRANDNAVFVNTEDSAGTNIDESFHLVVVC